MHNIMVLQDLVKHYGRKQAKSSCILKIDLQKAYDTVSWDFLMEMLTALGFPTTSTKLIMSYVTTPTFPIMLSGTMRGFFKSSRGLRQGDPMSPLLLCYAGSICQEF